jgi:hypothetical protein
MLKRGSVRHGGAMTDLERHLQPDPTRGPGDVRLDRILLIAAGLLVVLLIVIL